MNKLRLIIAASLRDLLRWARQHLYVLLILTPLVGGMTYLTAARAASYLPEGWQPRPAPALTLAAFAACALVALNLSRASVRIYHVRAQESFLDAMPAAPSTLLHAALAGVLARTLAGAAVVLLVARPLLGEAEILGAPSILALALFAALAALCEMFAALEWIHWGRAREARHVLAAIVVLLPSLALAGSLALLVVKPSILPAHVHAPLVAAGALCVVSLYALTRFLHTRWRVQDIEHAKRIQTAGRLSLFKLRAFERVGGRAVQSQLACDLQLTLRAFSSAVYVACVVAALSIAALVTALVTDLLPREAAAPGFFEATWSAPVLAVKVACVAACASLVCLLPVLVAHQIPHLWLARSAGTKAGDVWLAKLWYARLVTLPAPVVAWAAGVATGEVPVFYALPLLAECLWLWWAVSTLCGALAFEVAAEPGLGLVLMAFVSVGVGMLGAILWPFGLAAYGMGIDVVRERGAHRAHFHLLTMGED